MATDAKPKTTATHPGGDAEDLTPVAQALRVKCAEAARASRDFFIEYVVRDANGRDIRIEEIHREGYAFIDWAQSEGRYPVIMAPWGSGKTTMYVVPFALRAIGQDPNVRIGIFSNEEGLAADRVESIKSYIEDSREFRAVYPGVVANRDKWGTHGLMVKRPSKDPTPTVSPKGILGSKVGPRYDLIFCDDITDFENSVYSAAKRTAVDQRLHNTVMSRLSKTGNILFVATAWHSQDAVEKLKKDDRFAVLVQSVNDDCSTIEQTNLVTGERKTLPLPVTLDRKRLLHERANRPREFARGRQQRAYTEEEKTFSRESVLEAIVESDIVFASLKPLPKGYGIDLCGEARAGNALVGAAWEETEQRTNFFDCDVLKATSPQVCEAAVEKCRAHACDFMVVENNAYQQSFIEWGRAAHDESVPWESHTTGRNKADLMLGLPGFAASLGAGGVRFVFSERPEACRKFLCECTTGLCKLVKDLIAHPFGDDDSIMAAWFIWKKFRMTGAAADGGSPQNQSSQPRDRRLYSPRENIARHRRAGSRRRFF